MEPRLECVHPVLMSRDVDNSIRFYEKLGFVLVGQDTPVMPRYARMRRDGVELNFQWHDAKEWDYPNDRPTYRFVVQDVDGIYVQFRESGALVDAKPVTETPWGTREFHVRDPDRILPRVSGLKNPLPTPASRDSRREGTPLYTLRAIAAAALSGEAPSATNAPNRYSH